MHRYITVLNGDNINRYGYRFSVGALEDGIFQNAIIGVPSLLNHDAHRPIGWNFPFGLYFEPSLTRLVGEYLIAESDEDQTTINNAYKNALNKRHQELCAPYIEAFKKELKSVLNTEARYFYNGCVAYFDKNLLYRTYPELKLLQDKDGLIPLNDIFNKFDYLGQGIFKDRSRELAIFCHQYLRRNLSHLNNFNFHFIDQFIKLNSEKRIQLKIGLDPNLVGYPSSYYEQRELQYWWGPKYSDDIEKISTGVTHYESDDRLKLFTGICGTEFYWKSDNTQSILEIEELRNSPTAGADGNGYGCRYIHSIYNHRDKEFDHFDGAIKLYTDEEMDQRLSINLDKAGKNINYTKVFRVDGKLQLADWKSLITSYYQDNHLLYEYFGLKQEYEELWKSVTPVKGKSTKDKYVPYSIARSAGVKILVSYHNPTSIDKKFDRVVINPDSIVHKNGREKVIEFDAIEIGKALNRIGETISFPSNISLLKSQDLYINYPTILHSKVDVGRNLRGTLKAFLLLFNAMNKQAERTVTFTLAWPMGNREVRVSVFGNLKAAIEWLTENNSIPTDHKDFRKWLEHQNVWLSKGYSDCYSIPDLYDLVKRDGVIYIERTPLDSSWIKNLEEDESGVKYEIEIPKGHDDLLQAVEEKVLYPAFSFLVKDVRCSKTDQNYIKSKTSKILDDDVTAVLCKCSMMGAFWTDRPSTIS